MNKPILLFGGRCRERLVSVASAQTLLRCLADAEPWFWAPDGTVLAPRAEQLLAHADPFFQPFHARAPRVAQDLAEALERLRPGRLVVSALHGGEGEDGTVARWCEERGLACTGSGSRASALAFDKWAAREGVAATGLAVAKAIRFDLPEGSTRLQRFCGEVGEVVVKPVRDGSSFGMETIRSADQAAAWVGRQRAGSFLAEKRLSGTELTGGVVDLGDGPIALPTVEIRPKPGRWFDYRGKYLGEGVEELCPAQVDASGEDETRRAALAAHRVLGCCGYSRSDFIFAGGIPVYLETNTLPGLTATSLLPRALRAAGISLPRFIDAQGCLALRRAAADD